MEKKSLAVQIITVVVLMIGAYAELFGASVQAWLGIAAMAGTVALSTFFPSGTPVKGWTTVMWVVNIAGVVTQLLLAMGEQKLLDVQVVNGIIIGMNILIQVFAKDYATKKEA